jgi:hypothetical protein
MRYLVVARHREDLGWLDKLPDGWEPMVVEKGRDLPNTGREATSYLWAIEMLYDSLEDDDIVAFVQGDPFDHCPDLLARLPVRVRSFDPHGVGGFLDFGTAYQPTFADGSSHHPGIPVRAAYEKWLNRPWPGHVMFTGGAQFAVSGTMLKKRPVDWYRDLAKS